MPKTDAGKQTQIAVFIDSARMANSAANAIAQTAAEKQHKAKKQKNQ